MTSHDDCRRATEKIPRPMARRWECTACGELLASYDRGDEGIRLVLGLVPLPPAERHDRMPTYRLPPRVLRGQRPRASAQELARTRRAIFAYCPACAEGQHLLG